MAHRSTRRLVAVTLAAVASSAAVWRASGPPAARPLPVIVANDNVQSAGELRDGVLSLRLVAAAGNWYPELEAGPAHLVHAFGEDATKLSTPGPFVRVPVGTEIRVSVRNDIAGSTMIVHGLHDRPGPPDTVHVLAGTTRDVRFRVSSPGTYFYWATTRSARTIRDRFGPDTQLMGALVVDPPGARPDDRVFVIGIEDDSTANPLDRTTFAAVVNGRSWPHSQRFEDHVGDTIRMRWINATSRVHPIHLHGFHFRVDSKGDIDGDTIYAPDERRLAVTELITQAQTFTATWVPDRAGNWMVHCHILAHISPNLRRGPVHRRHDGTENHALDAMSGLAIGLRVLPAAGATTAEPDSRVPRRIRLLVQKQPGRFGAEPGLGFVIAEGREPAADSVVIPGPPLVLTRGYPVSITVVNRIAEPTSIHWHGIELESYFDGISGWSGEPGRLASPIAPGDSFTVRFTPPRAGTFIYHTHFHEEQQLASGLFGPLLVLEPGRTYDSELDRIWLLGAGKPGREASPFLNGSATPRLELHAGRTYRIRLININPNVPLSLALQADSVPVKWRRIAKDGADLPPAQSRTVPAQVRIGVGETYDFEFAPEKPGDLRVLVHDAFGRVRIDGLVHVRAVDASGTSR